MPPRVMSRPLTGRSPRVDCVGYDFWQLHAPRPYSLVVLYGLGIGCAHVTSFRHSLRSRQRIARRVSGGVLRVCYVDFVTFRRAAARSENSRYRSARS
jgi:hypothetical protein